MQQLQYITLLLIAGACMGFVFDVYNTVTGTSKWLRWLRGVLDLAFWLVSAVAVYYITFVTDDGRFRIYTFALLLIGYCIYRFTLHHWVVGSAFAIVRLFERVFGAVYRLVYGVTVRPLLIFCRFLFRLSQALYRFLCTVEDGVFWLLGVWLKILMWPFRRWIGPNSKFQREFTGTMEGIWIRTSNWLTRKSDRT